MRSKFDSVTPNVLGNPWAMHNMTLHEGSGQTIDFSWSSPGLTNNISSMTDDPFPVVGGEKSTAMMVSEEERRAYLEQLQEKTTLLLIPAMATIALMAVIGLVGNSLVLYVYSRRFNPNATRVLILMVAAVDLATNVIIIPGEVSGMFYAWLFDPPRLCQTRVFLNAVAIIASALLLSALAVVRYRKVCVPLGWQVTTRQARITALCLLLCALIFSTPYAIVHGQRRRPTPRPEIVVQECGIDDNFLDTIWLKILASFFFLLFVSSCTEIIVLYSLVGAKVWRHRRSYVVASSSRKDRSSIDGVAVTTSLSKPSVDFSSREGVDGYSQDNGKRKWSFISEKSSPFVRVSTSSKTVVFSKKSSQNKRRSTKSESDKDNTSGKRAVGGEDKVIEYYTDDEDADQVRQERNAEEPCAGVYTKRSLRSPTGSNADVNLSMVRELTMKLRAVQKQNSREENPIEENAGKEIEENSGDLNVPKVEGNSEWKYNPLEKHEHFSHQRAPSLRPKKNRLKAVQFHADKSPKTSNSFRRQEPPAASCQQVDTNGKHDIDATESTSDKSEDVQLTTSDSIQENTAAVSHNENLTNEAQDDHRNDDDDATNNNANNQKCNNDNGHAEVLDPGLSLDENLDDKLTEERSSTSDTDTQQSKEEPMSDFMKAMQWVDITYCSKDEDLDAENGQNQEDLQHGGKLSKKGSFSRKISRDNSFLRKHRKFRETLSDTLSRSKKNRKESNAAETARRKSVASSKLDVNESQSIDAAIEPKHSLNRTTLMLGLVSVVYITGLVVLLALMSWTHAAPERYTSLDGTALALYHLALRLYFLHCAVNPIIYAICNQRFRKECANLFRRIFLCFKS